MTEITSYCDVILGNEEDAEMHFGIKPEGLDVQTHGHDVKAEAFLSVCQQMMEKFPRAKKVITTLRGSISASHNTWAGVLYDGKQITRAALEDHFCGKLLGLPMGCDVCYTNHAEADQDDMDSLLTLLGVAGCNYIMGVPGADDIMLNYQSTSFHDAMYLRKVLNKRPAPEFEEWLLKMGIMDEQGNRKELKEQMLKLNS